MAEGLDFREVEGFLLRLPDQVKADVEELSVENLELRIESEREEERRRQNELLDLAGLPFEEDDEFGI